jgi:glycosyltransferase involved in cell wall biosynthesis
VGIDIRPLQTDLRFQGVGRYAAGLLEGLSKLDLPFTPVLFFDRNLAITPDVPSLARAEVIGIRRPRWESRTREIWNQFLTPFEVLFHRVSLLHVLAPEFIPAWLPVPRVATVHDLFAFNRESALQTGIKYRFLYRAVAKSSRILAISEATKRDFVTQYQRHASLVDVVHCGVDGRFLIPVSPEERVRVTAAFGLTTPFVLYVGDLRAESHNARKNLPALLEAFSLASRSARDWSLVFAGKQGAHSDRLRRMVQSAGLSDRVVFTDFVADADLPALIASATVFAYPSRQEGFGLPVLEALALGTPVLTSNRSAIPEVCGDAALLVDPDDASALAAALARLMGSPDLRRKLADRGRSRASTFTWTETARRTIAAYQRVLERHATFDN